MRILDRINLEAVILGVCVCLIALCMWAAVLNERKFVQYRIDHHCQRIGTRAGQSGGAYDSRGQYMTTFESDQAIYRCDGGEEIIR